MHVIVLSRPRDVDEYAASLVIAQITCKPESVLGVATGSSPIGVYQVIAHAVHAGVTDFGRASAFALDEYVGLGIDHPQSYAHAVRRHVTIPLRMNPANVHVPDGTADDLIAAAQDYDRAISDAGGVDLQILGIGSNGHIGFNEPTSSFGSRTRVKLLTQSTRSDNSRFFGKTEKVPHHCITQGLATIMESRRLVLVASGAGKAAPVARAIEGSVSSMAPASILQFHPDAIVVLDEEAASKLESVNYFKQAQNEEHVILPGWERHCLPDD